MWLGILLLVSFARGWVAIMLEPQVAKGHHSASIWLMLVRTQTILIMTVSISRINAITEPPVIIHH